MWISEFGKPDSPLQCFAICNLVWELSGSFLCEHHCFPNCAANNRCSKAKNDTMWTMEQWGPFFSLLLPGGGKKKDPYKTKNWAGIIVFQVCDSERLSIFLFFQGGDKMMPCTKEREVWTVTHTSTDTGAGEGRVLPKTHTPVRIYTRCVWAGAPLMSCVLVCMLTGISDGC